MNKRIVFMGTPSFAANVLEGLIDNNYEIIAVVTQEDKKVGRKQILTPSPCKEVALKHNILCLTPHKIKDDYQEIINLNPDLIITCAYGQFIPIELIEYPRYKAINTHGSLLPKYRGGAPIQWSIINGEEKTGISIIYMSKGMDEGDILYQEELKIEEDDTNTSLFNKLSDLALKCLLTFLPDFFEGNFYATKQNEDEVSFAYNLNKQDEYINFNDDVKKVYNHIRGLLDNPGAYSVLENKKYKFLKVGYSIDNDTEPLCFKGLENNYLRVDCKNGYIKIYEIRPEGKNTMDGKSFYNGVGKSLVNKKFLESYE